MEKIKDFFKRIFSKDRIVDTAIVFAAGMILGLIIMSL